MGASGRHLALRLRQHNVTLRGVAFGGGEWAAEIANLKGPFHVAFRPVINEFAGRGTVERTWPIGDRPTRVCRPIQLSDRRPPQSNGVAAAIACLFRPVY